MAVWKEYKIGDLCDTISETYRGHDEEVILINTSDVLEGRILNHQKVPNRNVKGQFKKTFKTQDILYSEIRPENNRFAYVDMKDTSLYIASTKLMVIRANIEIIEPRFLYAILTAKSMTQELQVRAELRSGTFPQITFKTELATIKVCVPDRNTQKKIVSFLDAINRKIEMNNKINRNLSEQASAYYENWKMSLTGEAVELSKVIDVRDGTHASPKPQDEGYPLVTSKHLFEYDVDLESPNKISQDDYDKTNERSKVEYHDVLMSMIGTVGVVSFISRQEINFAIKNVALFRTSQREELAYYVLLFLKSKDTKQYIKSCMAGSTQQYISLTELRKIPIIVPGEEIKEFNLVIKPIIDMICANVIENRRLSELRDTLLPKLMSGELDVSNLDI